MLKFDTRSMTRLFDAAAARARDGEVWAAGSEAPETVAGLLAKTFRFGD